MTTPDKSTMKYYNEHTQSFIDNTFTMEITSSLEKFKHALPVNAKVLDVGCGSGRDSLYFLNNGIEVVAFDASEEMAFLASQKINHPVLVKNIEDMNWENEFDGVWAMASLLHLKKEYIQEAITSCIKSLKQDTAGLFFASLKMGTGEGYDEKGRFFSYYTKEELSNILEKTEYFRNIEFDINQDKLDRPGLSWISFIAEKKPELILNKAKIKKNKM